MNPQDRYLHDPKFALLVDTLHAQLRDVSYTPTEVREAAMLAQIHFEQYRPRQIVHPDATTATKRAWAYGTHEWSKPHEP